MSKKALVVLSGGQDSATCAAWANSKFDSLEFITFDYGQKHIKEIDAAKKIAAFYNAKHKVVEVPLLKESKSALTDHSLDINKVDEKTNLPASFVAGRNIVFLTQAASYAISNGIYDLVTGVCQTDFSGYPDCRQVTIDSIAISMYLGCENLVNKSGFRIHTPLMYLTKAETVKLAKYLDTGWEVLKLSWTCYNGGEKPCGQCPACLLRIKGFQEANEVDPAL